MRGSPHLHALIWTEDCPKLTSETKEAYIIRPISSVTSHHVTLRTGGQASVCLQHGGESDYEAWVTRLF